MRYLIDASALLDLIRKKREEILDQYILDLTIYEIGNAIWKEAYLFKTLTKREATDFMKNFSNIKVKMKIIKVENDLEDIMDMAIKEKLTFYDAAYLYFAIKNKLVLVTNDKKLYEVAKNKIKVIKSNDF